MTPAERDQLEANHCVERIIQLECAPIRGQFDAHHLKKINAYIFQDLPGAGLKDVTPGQFRPPCTSREKLDQDSPPFYFKRFIRCHLFPNGQTIVAARG